MVRPTDLGAKWALKLPRKLSRGLARDRSSLDVPPLYSRVKSCSHSGSLVRVKSSLRMPRGRLTDQTTPDEDARETLLRPDGRPASLLRFLQ